MKRLSWLATEGLCLLVVLLITGIPTARAQSAYPPAHDAYVNDFTGRLSASEGEKIRVLLRQARQETGVEATVVVIDSIDDYPMNDPSIESFATHLFNEWGIGDADRDDGVLFLVALGDRKVRIEIGAGYGAYNSELMKRILDHHVLPHFKAGNIGEGIYAGIRSTLSELTDWQPAVPKTPRSAVATPAVTTPAVATPARKTIPTWPSGPVGIGFSLVLLAGASMGGRLIYRYRRRRCFRCGAAMRRLDETEEDQFLMSGQQTEEILKSMEYDVWKCDSCDHTTVTAWRQWFSSYRTCPSCGLRALLRQTHILEQATYTSSGEKEILRSCRSCDYDRREVVTIPRLEANSDDDYSSSSSSGSTSFGGGSSSGGGATASW